MFVTEVCSIATPFEPGVGTGWNWVNFDSDFPIYLVTLTWLVDAEHQYTQRMYNHYSQIRRLIEGESEGEYKVDKIELLSPPNLNLTQDWSISPLKAIYAYDFYSTTSELIYELDNGTRYSTSNLPSDSDITDYLQLLTKQPSYAIWQVPEEFMV
ncbi:hypothetical protein [Chitinimonas naiadis]